MIFAIVFFIWTRISGPFGPEILALSGLGSNWSKAFDLFVVLRFWDVLIVAYIFMSYSEEWLRLTLWLYDDLYPMMDMMLLIGLHKPSSYQNEIKVYRFFYTKQTIGFRLSWRHTYIVHPKSNVNFDCNFSYCDIVYVFFCPLIT